LCCILRCPRTGLMVRHRSRKRLPALLRAIILFKLEQLSILTVCFSGTFRVSSLERPHPTSVRLQRGCARHRLGRQAPSPAPATAGPRHAGDEARDAREHWADAVELAFHVNKIPISAAIEGRGAQEMVALVLRRRIRPDSRIAPSYRRKEGGGHV